MQWNGSLHLYVKKGKGKEKGYFSCELVPVLYPHKIQPWERKHKGLVTGGTHFLQYLQMYVADRFRDSFGYTATKVRNPYCFPQTGTKHLECTINNLKYSTPCPVAPL